MFPVVSTCSPYSYLLSSSCSYRNLLIQCKFHRSDLLMFCVCMRFQGSWVENRVMVRHFSYLLYSKVVNVLEDLFLVWAVLDPPSRFSPFFESSWSYGTRWPIELQTFVYAWTATRCKDQRSRRSSRSVRTADVSLRSLPLRDVSRGERHGPPRETSLSGEERGETSAVRRL